MLGSWKHLRKNGARHTWFFSINVSTAREEEECLRETKAGSKALQMIKLSYSSWGHSSPQLYMMGTTGTVDGEGRKLQSYARCSIVPFVVNAERSEETADCHAPNRVFCDSPPYCMGLRTIRVLRLTISITSMEARSKGGAGITPS